ncbi:MAG: 3'(2'),5'-bisphosphate nucleotidase CysQ [Rikenellaceae bacterium]
MLSNEQRIFLLTKAYNAALRAGKVILELYEQGADKNQDIDLKTDLTPITLADLRAHATIKEYLSQTRIPLLSEEGREMQYFERSHWDLFWMVDPLDGTKEFLKRNGEFTVSIALMVDNKPQLGVIYVPYLSKIYFSDTQEGSFVKVNAVADENADFSYADIVEGCESLPLKTECNSPIKVGVSRSHINELTYKYIDSLREKYPDLETVIQGSSYKFCLLAEGVIDYYVRTTNTYEWDTAAGEVILQMTGGETLELDSLKPMDYNKESSLQNPFFVCKSKFFKEK